MIQSNITLQFLVLSAFMIVSTMAWPICNGTKVNCNPLEAPPPGYFCSTDSTVGCGLVCIDEAYCPGQTTVVIIVGTTKTNKIGISTTPSPLPNVCGYYYPPGSSTNTPCPPEYFCPNGPDENTPIVPELCPPGKYCPLGTCLPETCACGYKCPPGSSTPTECMPPFYCPDEGASNMTICPISYMCPNRAMCTPIACQLGTFVTCPGKVRCDPCDAGRYCPTTTSMLICPAGNYCPMGSSAPTPCPVGFYCNIGSKTPEACPAGYSCPEGSSAAN
jgi:hypothetical protein